MNIIHMIEIILNNTILYATPLLLAALGGVLSERSGIANIALEGFMTVGAFAAAVVTIFFGETLGLGSLAPWIGVVAAFVLGTLFAVPHAVATIHLKADHIVSGVALNFLAAGFAIVMTKFLFNGAAQTTTVQHVFDKVKIPYLSDLPIIGKGILYAYPTSYIAIVLVGVVSVVLFRTSFGLRLRAVGEHPHAADTVGIRVILYRYIAVLLSGGLAGIGGAGLSIAITGNFQHNTVAGQGYMALAAMIFGKWKPIGSMWAALFFGFATALAASGQVIGLTQYVPAEFLIMLPYILTILALAGLVGRAQAPAALGIPYEKGKR